MKQPFHLKVGVKKLNDLATIPEYKSVGAAGFDLATTEDIIIPANSIFKSYDGEEIYLINNNSAIAGTGLSFEIPEGYELEVRGRSGNAFKYRVFSFNGTIDCDYRGEVKLLLMNFGDKDIEFKAGERVAQGVIKKIEQVTFIEKEELSETERGENGLGSTGLKA
ncbi:dUTP diphosphatase [Paenibacillus spiritus]|uniref:dUTP diphosphatase n=2 Tax=Paenibacillus spiritus TaxID=2496557 RepID=A0A5J5GHS3_9BACL|nr:dUTP diphosphatase [Paenibacillus spiritus]